MYSIKINYILIIIICLFLIIESTKIQKLSQIKKTTKFKTLSEINIDSTGSKIISKIHKSKAMEVKLSEIPKSKEMEVILSEIPIEEQNNIIKICTEALSKGLSGLLNKMTGVQALKKILKKFTEQIIEKNVKDILLQYTIEYTIIQILKLKFSYLKMKISLKLYTDEVYHNFPINSFHLMTPRDHCSEICTKKEGSRQNCIDNILKLKFAFSNADASNEEIFDCVYKKLNSNITNKYTKETGNLHIEEYFRQVTDKILSLCKHIDCKIPVPITYCSSLEYFQAFFKYYSDQIISEENSLKELFIFSESYNTQNETKDKLENGPGDTHENKPQNMDKRAQTDQSEIVDMEWFDNYDNEQFTDEWINELLEKN